MKFIEIESFGNKTFINIKYIESIISINNKTRIVAVNNDGYFETNESIEEVMKKIINI